jgi:hypothetical protein
MYNEPKVVSASCAQGMGPGNAKELQVPEQISIQCERIKELYKIAEAADAAISNLADRTNPVRTEVLSFPEANDPDSQPPNQTALVPVADAIRSNNYSLDDLARRLSISVKRISNISSALQI